MAMKRIFVSVLLMTLACPAVADEAGMAQQLIATAKNNGAGKPTLFQQDEAIISLSVLRATAVECNSYKIESNVDGVTFSGEGYRFKSVVDSTSPSSPVCTGEYVRIGSLEMVSGGSDIYFDHCDDDGIFDSVSIHGDETYDVAQTHQALVEFIHSKLFP
jgi:hypothetical protein